MSKKMLIDAAQAEEVRVCVTENGKVEDFDFESSARKPLRGNIYLARVTRVEPSLQAAFVEYGGNRHGFLAFNEIHPDYYQIPVSDRQLLQEAEAEEAALAAELDVVQRGDEDEEDDRGADFDGDDQTAFADDDAAGENEDESAEDREDADDNPTESFQAPHSDDDSTVVLDDDAAEAESDDDDARTVAMAASPFPSVSTLSDDVADEEEAVADNDDSDDTGRTDADAGQSLEEDNDVAAAAFYDDDADAEDDSDDVVGDSVDGASDEDEDDDDENGGDDKKSKRAYRQQLIERYKEARRKRAKLIRNYKIQEVVKRRQILLVQVVKEERGNKGAALTTYLSLAGRYCVLMPNTARGGGISRKIPNASDRKRLRRVVDSLDVAQGMGLIIRTAGAKRTKTEIKRDYDYLTRLWETIRSQTLESIAPCLIYEEASLIKRAIRDLYDKDISTVLVEGEDGYREAKDFMKMLMPSHAKNVQPYKDKLPLFVRYDVEKQLDAMYQPVVRLKSGGYIVINQTEALIAIDVNSGKATRERNIELTALKTNIEAAAETARQCRLRDLAGLIVIDFIDMEENKNNRTVEKKLKDALKHDRARIQVGRISNFGLLEMSRQRRRSGIVDGTTNACPTCNGAGAVRSSEMAALRILRAIESEAIAGRAGVISVRASLDVTLYVLNNKRTWLKRLEDDYALTIEVIADQSKAGDQYDIEKRGAARPQEAGGDVIRADTVETLTEADDDTDQEDAGKAQAAEDDAEKQGKRRRRRRRKKRSDGDDAERRSEAQSEGGDDEIRGDGPEDDDGDDETGKPLQDQNADNDDDEKSERKKRRRRGRRGGRRQNKKDGDARDEGAHDQGDSSDGLADDGPVDNGLVDDELADDGHTDGDVAARESANYAGESTDSEPSSRELDTDEATPPETQAVSSNIAEVAPPPDDALEPANSRETTVETEVRAEDEPPAEPAAATPEEVAERLKSRKTTKKGWWSRALGG